MHQLTKFFECCLKDGAAPIAPKIMQVRENLSASGLSETHHVPGQTFQVSGDMIVGDLLFTFPQIEPLLQDWHPLGLLSPALNRTSLELFFSDLPVDLKDICLKLNQVINQKAPRHG